MLSKRNSPSPLRNFYVSEDDSKQNSIRTPNTISLEEETEPEEALYIHEKKYKKIANKLRVSSRTYFKHRNLIKKVKTNCINVYEKIINSCLNLTQPLFSLGNGKNKRKRDVLRYFKCDISKLRNFLLLNIPMKNIISLFSDFQLNENYIIEKKRLKLQLLLNMTWKDFMVCLKNGVKEVTEGFEAQIKVTKKDFDIFFNYILEINYVYDLRPSVDSLYANSLDKILCFGVKDSTEEQRKKEMIDYLSSFRGFV